MVQGVDVYTDGGVLRFTSPQDYWNHVAIYKHYLLSTNLFPTSFIYSLSPLEIIWLRDMVQMVIIFNLDHDMQLIAIEYLMTNIHHLPTQDEILNLLTFLQNVPNGIPAEKIINYLSDLNNQHPF